MALDPEQRGQAQHRPSSSPWLEAGAFDPGGRGWRLSYGQWLMAIVIFVWAT